MRKCELCGEEVPKGSSKCSRCGFEFPPEITSDARNEVILSKHDGKEPEDIKKGLEQRFSMYISYFNNLIPGSIDSHEFAAFVEEAVSHLHIPHILELGHVLSFNDKEEKIISTISERVLSPNSPELPTFIQTRTMIMLANGLYSLEMKERSLKMAELAVQRDPRDMDAQFGRAKLLFFEKDYTRARKCLEKVLARDPDRGDVKALLEMMEQFGSQQS